MKVLVCGSRGWTDERRLREELLEIWAADGISEIIHGGAKGADSMAGKLARVLAADGHAITETEVKADWQRYGRSAGFRRNLEMLDMNPELVVAFWDGKSRGTKHTIDEARKRGITTVVLIELEP